MQVTLDVPVDGTNATFVLEALDGEVVFAPNDESRVKLTSPATFRSRSGSLDIDALIARMPANVSTTAFRDGSWTPTTGDHVNFTFSGVAIPIPVPAEFAADSRDEIDAVRLSVQTNDADANVVDVTFGADATASDATPPKIAGSGVIKFDAGTPTAIQQADVRAENLPVARLQPFLGDLPVVLERDIGADAGMMLVVDNAGSFRAEVQADALQLDAQGMIVDGNAFSVESMTIDTTVRPELVAGFTDAATIEEAIPVTLSIDPFVVGHNDNAGVPLNGNIVVPMFPDVRLPSSEMEVTGIRLASTFAFDDVLDAKNTWSARMVLNDGAIGGGPLKERVLIQEVWSDVSAPDESGTLNAAADIQLAGEDRTPLGKFTTSFARAADGTIQVHVDGTEVVLGTLLSVTGQSEQGDWLAPASTKNPGNVQASASLNDDDRRFTLDAGFTDLIASIAGEISDGRVRLDEGSATAGLAGDKVTSLLASGQQPDTTSQPIQVPQNVPVTVLLDRVDVAFPGEPEGTAQPDIVKASVTIPSAVIRAPDGVERIVRGINVALDTDDLRDGLDVAFFGTVVDGLEESDKVTASGVIDGTLRAANFYDASGKLAPANAVVSGVLKLNGVPTTLIDAFASLDGMLVDAVGPTLNGSFTPKAFGRTRGDLAFDITTPRGTLAGGIQATEDAFVVAEDSPITGSLEISPPLRRRFLSSTSPFLGDIARTTEPVTVNLASGTRLPTSGGLSGLQASIDLNFGPLELDASSDAIAFVQLLTDRGDGSGHTDTIPASIEPVKMFIRDGVLGYEQFRMQIGPVVIEHGPKSRVDLINKRIDLRFRMPAATLKPKIRELRVLQDDFAIPVAYRGPLGKAELVIDPDIDLGKLIADAGVGALIGEIERKNDLPPGVGDLIGDIFRGLGGG